MKAECTALCIADKENLKSSTSRIYYSCLKMCKHLFYHSLAEENKKYKAYFALLFIIMWQGSNLIINIRTNTDLLELKVTELFIKTNRCLYCDSSERHRLYLAYFRNNHLKLFQRLGSEVRIRSLRYANCCHNNKALFTCECGQSTVLRIKIS